MHQFRPKSDRRRKKRSRAKTDPVVACCLPACLLPACFLPTCLHTRGACLVHTPAFCITFQGHGRCCIPRTVEKSTGCSTVERALLSRQGKQRTKNRKQKAHKRKLVPKAMDSGNHKVGNLRPENSRRRKMPIAGLTLEADNVTSQSVTT